MAAYVIESDAKTAKRLDAHPCPPVEFGDAIDPALTWNQPSENDLHKFKLSIAVARQAQNNLPNHDTELTCQHGTPVHKVYVNCISHVTLRHLLTHLGCVYNLSL